MTDQLRDQVRAAVKASGRKQIWIADKLGISPKHLSQMLTGRVSLTLDWAQQIAVLCDARVLIFVTAPPGAPDRETRIPLDDLTSNDLDRLYDDLDRYTEIVGEMNDAAVLAAKKITEADEAARRALAQRQEMAAERYAWQERGDQAEAAIIRVRNACDQLRRAAVLADGQPHTDRERGILQAVDRITRALDKPAARPAATQATDESCSPDGAETEPNTWTEPTHTHPCTATIKGRATPGGRQVQCTREAGHPENHVGPKQGSNGRVLWTDSNAGAVPHRRG
jgi:transcriptional regulator with XRE-family HTH domain